MAAVRHRRQKRSDYAAQSRSASFSRGAARKPGLGLGLRSSSQTSSSPSTDGRLVERWLAMILQTTTFSDPSLRYPRRWRNSSVDSLATDILMHGGGSGRTGRKWRKVYRLGLQGIFSYYFLYFYILYF